MPFAHSMNFPFPSRSNGAVLGLMLAATAWATPLVASVDPDVAAGWEAYHTQDEEKALKELAADQRPGSDEYRRGVAQYAKAFALVERPRAAGKSAGGAGRSKGHPCGAVAARRGSVAVAGAV